MREYNYQSIEKTGFLKQHLEKKMELNRYAFESYKMYDSKTNDIIASTLDQDINEDADSLIAYWANLEEPIINDEDLLEDWGKIVSKYMKENYEERPDYDDLINYLQNYFC